MVVDLERELSEVAGKALLEMLFQMQRSSVELTVNARGRIQVRVRVYAGDDEGVLARVGAVALQQLHETIGELHRLGLEPELAESSQ